MYRIKPDGPNGEVVLVAVNSAGHRVRITGELDPAEVGIAADALERWLNACDPVVAGAAMMRVI